MDILEVSTRVMMFIVPFLFSLCFHEFAHGFIAKLRGDNTAEMMGRLTLNPMAHADPIGTIVLPIAAVLFNLPFIGWAKPVPVNSRNLKNPRVDMFWIALAGPLSNILLAFVSTFLLVILSKNFIQFSYYKGTVDLIDMLIMINLFLAFFNLIPINPLDGGKILARFLPAHWNDFLERHEMMISMALLMVALAGFLRILIYPVMITKNLFLQLALAII